MFETIFKDSAKSVEIGAELTAGTGLNMSNTLLALIVSLLLGLVISIIYLVSTPKKNHSSSFAMSLVILPTLVTIVILLVGGNLARAFSLAGVFTLVRFRSVPGDSKDISFVFFTMAVGLTTGMGYLTFGAIITLIIGLTIFVVQKIGFGEVKEKEKQLKIMIPEDINYQGVFDDLFAKYTTKCDMLRVKTTNLGTLYELTYRVVLKEGIFEKDFIDDLRCRNGNLNIILSLKEGNSQML